MDIERMTVRVQKSLNDAYNEAVKHHNQQVDVIHLFSALVNQEDGLIPNIFEKMNVSVAALKSTIDEELGKIPQIYGEGISSQGVTASRRIEEVLIKAEEISKDFKDSYISVEHVMLAMMETESKSVVGKILKMYGINKNDFLQVLSSVRGSQRVDSNDPEGTYDALAKFGTNLVDLAKKHKLDPVIGRDEEIRRIIRILSRRTKNNPVLIGEPGEIEAAIGALPEIHACVCIYLETTDEILLFYQGKIKQEALSAAVSGKLPAYMRPNKFIRIRQMPYNSNGKVDRKLLKTNYLEENQL